jgi:O-antigen/teichoic acid export membrane protein
MHARKFVRDAVGLAGSQYLVRAVLMARGVIAAKLLGPAGYGAWNGLMLLLEYTTQAHLGTLQGLDQTVPGRIVARDEAALERVKRAGLFNLAVLALIATIVLIAYFARSSGQLRDYWGLGGIVLALACAILTLLANYHTGLLRSHGDIPSMSLWSVIQGLIGAFLGVALLALWPAAGAWGLLWGWFAGSAVALVYVRWKGRAVVPLVPLPSRDAIRLLVVGLPMFLFVSFQFVMRSLDRVLVLRFLGTEALGYYSLAVMAVGLLLYMPDAISYVLYPKLLRLYHEAGDRPEAIREPVERASRAISLLLPALCALAYLAADDAVRWILPRFREGVPPLRILCFGAAALGLANLSAVVLMTLRRHRLLIPAAVAGTALGAVSILFVIRAGFGIRGVAWATLATYAFSSALLLVLAYGGLAAGWRPRLAMIARAFAPLAVAIPIAYLCNAWLPWAERGPVLETVRLVLGMALFLAVYAAAVAPLARGIGLRQIVVETRLPGLGRLRNAGGEAAT